MASLPTAGARAASTAVVRQLGGSGEWTVTQDYGGGAGITFDQHFSFSLRAGHRSSVPLAGGTVKVALRLTVRSSAHGTFNDLSVSPPELTSYTCAATATTTQRATLRLAGPSGAGRVTAIPLRALAPGDPDCTPSESIEWPTGDDWFARAMTVRTTPTAGALFARSIWRRRRGPTTARILRRSSGRAPSNSAGRGTLRLGRS